MGRRPRLDVPARLFAELVPLRVLPGPHADGPLPGPERPGARPPRGGRQLRAGPTWQDGHNTGIYSFPCCAACACADCGGEKRWSFSQGRPLHRSACSSRSTWWAGSSSSGARGAAARGRSRRGARRARFAAHRHRLRHNYSTPGHRVSHHHLDVPPAQGPRTGVPSTLNVGHTRHGGRTFIYISIVAADVTTLVAMIAASVADAWLGAGW